jgi:RNA-binding protein
MLTGKQKRYLRSLANRIKPLVFIGKESLSSGLVEQLENELENRELVKVSVQQNAPFKAREGGELAADLTRSELVQVIGRKFVLYKRSDDDPRIELPA